MDPAVRLVRLFETLNRDDWSMPFASLRTAENEIAGIPDLDVCVGRYLETRSLEELAALSSLAYNEPTRFRAPVYLSPQYQAWLQVSSRAFPDRSSMRAFIHSKGYFQLAVVLRGWMEVEYFEYTGLAQMPPDFSDVLLSNSGTVRLTPGNVFLNAPNTIHRVVNVGPETTTLTLRPTAVVGPMRILHRNMGNISVEEVPFNPERLLREARLLTRPATSPQV